MRREFSAKTKVQAFERSGGHCEICDCKLFSGNIHFDHRNPDALGGDPDLDNCSVVCRNCHKTKTQGDVRKIAKTRRVHRRHIGIKKPRTIRAWRKFNGTPVYADRER